MNENEMAVLIVNDNGTLLLVNNVIINNLEPNVLPERCAYKILRDEALVKLWKWLKYCIYFINEQEAAQFCMKNNIELLKIIR